MTGQLTELMRDRADALDGPVLDFYGLVREGDRRVRRRRVALAGGLAALAVAAGLVAPLVVDGTDDRGALDPDLATAFGAPSPAYAVGSSSPWTARRSTSAVPCTRSSRRAPASCSAT